MSDKSLKEKSLENIESADLLVGKGYFDSSVHCSYYGCLQLIKLALNEKANIDFETQFRESKSDSRGSHIYYLSKFKTFFKNGALRNEIEVQTNSVRKLKELRVRADYDPIKVEPEKCAEAVMTAKSFRDFIFESIKLKV